MYGSAIRTYAESQGWPDPEDPPSQPVPISDISPNPEQGRSPCRSRRSAISRSGLFPSSLPFLVLRWFEQVYLAAYPNAEHPGRDFDGNGNLHLHPDGLDVQVAFKGIFSERHHSLATTLSYQSRRGSGLTLSFQVQPTSGKASQQGSNLLSPTRGVLCTGYLLSLAHYSRSGLARRSDQDGGPWL